MKWKVIFCSSLPPTTILFKCMQSSIDGGDPNLTLCPIFVSISFEFPIAAYRNPSSGSLAMSETGSLDRMKAAVERRKKGLDDSVTTVSERVEGTRVNPDSLISELLANTELLESGESMFAGQSVWLSWWRPPSTMPTTFFFHLMSLSALRIW